jgi:predicted nucleotidyltransferase component of viral defense system
MPANRYRKQTELLLRVLPLVMREEVFALKGGTAINFFWRDYPRLSVDIDLTYLKIQDYEKTLLDISDRLVAIEERVKRIIPNIFIQQKYVRESKKVSGLIIRSEDSNIKVEPNIILRGSVYPIETKKLSVKAEKAFGTSFSVNTLSFEDLYGGKICAALDRQHPRDLFDIKLLLDNEGITEKLKKAFIVYLISHSRPIVEILNPNEKDISGIWENEFKGMTVDEVTLKDLINARAVLIKKVKVLLNENEKKFLISFKKKEPQWKLLGLDGIEDLPAVKWKLKNLEKLNNKKHDIFVKKLEDFLNIN